MSEGTRPAAVVAVVLLAGCVGAVGGPATDARPTGDATTRPHPGTEPVTEATVTAVVDGDTVRVRFPNGTAATVRLIGVDAPEVGGENEPGEFEGVPDTAAGRACLRRAGEAASAAARERLADARVGLGFDPEEARRGYYGRLLAYVYLDGRQFNHRLVAAGHARLYESAFVERSRYADAEARARAADRGVWRCADPPATS